MRLFGLGVGRPGRGWGWVSCTCDSLYKQSLLPLRLDQKQVSLTTRCTHPQPQYNIWDTVWY